MKSLFSVIIITFAIAIGCDTPYTNDFLGNGVSVDDIVDDLDGYAEPGECITDGFDWLCRSEIHVVTLEIIREVEVEVIREVKVEVPVEVEVIREVEKPIIIKELYAVIVNPNETIQTPVGIIVTDTTGTVVTTPQGVDGNGCYCSKRRWCNSANRHATEPASSTTAEHPRRQW